MKDETKGGEEIIEKDDDTNGSVTSNDDEILPKIDTLKLVMDKLCTE